MIGRPDYKIFNNEKDFQKISKVIRGYKLIRDVKKNKFLKKTDFFTIRMLDNSNITKFSKIIKLILFKKINRNLKKGKILSINDFKK